jgi:transcription initiation factor TFIID subunit 7
MTKLTVNTDGAALPTPKLKISFKKSSDTLNEQSSPAGAPAAEQPKPKRKYTKKPKLEPTGDAAVPSPAPVTKNPKKRVRKDDEDGAESPAKRPAKLNRIPSMKLKLGNAAAAPPVALKTSLLPKIITGASAKSPRAVLRLRQNTQMLKVKTLGAPPARPIGVGYDSEADDVEIDPAIENQFILRMQPGEDCDYLRKAITERRVGLRQSEGGADVSFKFFDKEGRRAMVSIRGKHYAAVLVDLPCIIEGLKSWDKRSFMKVADVHQMLLVIGLVQTDEEAKNATLPDGVDRTNYQYAHGLTPPMHYVRKRRFRKRVSHRTIEAVEEEVERLLAADDDARKTGGNSEYQMFEPERLRDDTDSRQPSEDIDAYGEEVQDSIEAYEDDDEMARLMAEEFEKEANGGPTVVTGTETNESPDTAQPTETSVPSPSASEESLDDSVNESDIGDEERADQQERAQQREEIDDVKKEIASVEKQIQDQRNPLLKIKLQGKKQKLNRDLQLKLANLGEEEEEN